jgi:hypothetical protein
MKRSGLDFIVTFGCPPGQHDYGLVCSLDRVGNIIEVSGKEENIEAVAL